jgi:hypothetical protein
MPSPLSIWPASRPGAGFSGSSARSSACREPACRRAGGGRYLLDRNDGSQDQDVVTVADDLAALAAGSRVLIDPAECSADGTTSLRGAKLSPDGKWLAYGVSQAGSEHRARALRIRETTHRYSSEGRPPSAWRIKASTCSPSTRFTSISTVSPPSCWTRIRTSDLRGCASHAFSDVASTDSVPPEPTATTSTSASAPSSPSPGIGPAAPSLPASSGSPRSQSLSDSMLAARSSPTHEIRTCTAPPLRPKLF